SECNLSHLAPVSHKIGTLFPPCCTSDCTVVGIPGRIISRKKQVEDPLNSQALPDLEAQAIRALFDRIKDLEEQVDFLKSQLSPLKTTQSEQAEVEKHELFLSSDLFITQFLDGAGI
ncbi:hypothetical protein QUA70_25895, partial [Microcoleus sp. LAD1_D5]